MCVEVLAVLNERVQALSKEVEVCAKKPGDALTRSVTIFFETVKKHTQGKPLWLCERTLLHAHMHAFYRALCLPLDLSCSV